MAKKTLTPEQAEIKAMKKEKSSQNWTKFWAIVLAAALTFGVVFLGKSQADKAIEEAGANNNAVVDQNNDVNNNDDADDDSLLGDDTSNDNVSNDNTSNDNTSNDNTSNDNTSNDNSSSNNNNSSNNNSSSNNNAQQNNGPSKAEVIKVFNEATAKAAKGSYKIKRTGEFTKPINVGSATDKLNDIIHGIDPNASIDSVVGGFLGISKPVEAVVTNGAGEGFDGKYMIKAMTLTEADVQGVKVEGNKYMLQVKKCTNPDENSAMAKATNDYITFAQVNESLKKEAAGMVSVDAAKSQAVYSSILFTATIVDGKMTNLEYSYTFAANLSLKIIVAPATGTGEAKITGVYSDIKY